MADCTATRLTDLFYLMHDAGTFERNWAVLGNWVNEDLGQNDYDKFVQFNEQEETREKEGANFLCSRMSERDILELLLDKGQLSQDVLEKWFLEWNMAHNESDYIQLFHDYGIDVVRLYFNPDGVSPEDGPFICSNNENYETPLQLLQTFIDLGVMNNNVEEKYRQFIFSMYVDALLSPSDEELSEQLEGLQMLSDNKVLPTNDYIEEIIRDCLDDEDNSTIVDKLRDLH